MSKKFYRKTEEDYHELAKIKGFKWLGTIIPPKIGHKTEWECSKGHRTQKAYVVLSKPNAGCKICNSKVRKTEEDYLNIGKPYGISWIGDIIPKNNKTKTLWKCSEGHIWEAAYSWLSSGNGCYYCSGVSRKERSDYETVGTEREIFWIGNVVPSNCTELTDWKCKFGHEWKTSYTQIQTGHGCHYCKHKNERECKEIFEKLFGVKFPKKRPDWLRYTETKGKLELDGYNEELSLAFEHDGRQHFIVDPFLNTLEQLVETQKRDRFKGLKCKENNVILIRIPYTVRRNKEAYILKQLEYYPHLTVITKQKA